MRNPRFISLCTLYTLRLAPRALKTTTSAITTTNKTTAPMTGHAPPTDDAGAGVGSIKVGEPAFCIERTNAVTSSIC